MAKQRSRPTRRRDKKGGPGSGRRKSCGYCRDKVDQVDYKDVTSLKKYVSDRGKIRSRRITGACRRHQNQIATAVKRAREIALLPVRRRQPRGPRRARPAAARRPRPGPGALGRCPRPSCSQDHENLGAKGTVVDVSKGYLRNYLIPRKLAEPATKGAVEAAKRRAVAAERAVADRDGQGGGDGRAAQQDRPDDRPPGGRRRPPVRLRHVAGHRRRHQGGARRDHRPPRRPPRGADPHRRHAHGRGRGRDGVTATVKTMVVEQK